MSVFNGIWENITKNVTFMNGKENLFKIDSITNINKTKRFLDKFLHDQFKTEQITNANKINLI